MNSDRHCVPMDSRQAAASCWFTRDNRTMVKEHTVPDRNDIIHGWRGIAAFQVSDNVMMPSPKSSVNVCSDAALLTADLMLKRQVSVVYELKHS